MTSRIRSEDAIEIRFGAGRNTRGSPDQIDPRECADGENFILDPGNDELRRRKAFDKLGTVPNGASISGFVTLKKTDGSVSMLVQAGATVYEWDGVDFSSVGTVSANAKLRGRMESFWAVGDKVLISDLALEEGIASWDGTTFQSETLYQKDGSTVFTGFKAKYILVDNERALFANIDDNGTAYPHLLVGTTRGDFSTLIDTGVADADRPSNSLSVDAPFFVPTPQLKPINGLARAYGIIAISQQDGAFEKLTGDTAQDFALEQLHDGSGAAGDEAVVSTFNDVIYGAPGHIESLRSTDEFGDVELDDISFQIRGDIEGYDDWVLVYNKRLRRIYCYPSESSNQLHVLFTDFMNTQWSPWSKFTTKNEFSFQITAMMNCFDPVDGLEYTYMGDSSGNLYRLEGSGDLDAGQSLISVWRRSPLQSAPADTEAFNISGYVRHRRLEANDCKLKFEFAGEHAHDVNRTVSLQAVTGFPVYNGTAYYNGNYYYGIAQENRLVRKTFECSGHSNEFQVRIEIEAQKDFAINQVGLRVDFAK